MSTKMRDEMFREAILCAFEKLPPEQKEELDAYVTEIRSKVHLIGPTSALEMLAKVGIFSATQIKELTELLDLIDSCESTEKVESKWSQAPISSVKMEMVGS